MNALYYDPVSEMFERETEATVHALEAEQDSAEAADADYARSDEGIVDDDDEPCTEVCYNIVTEMYEAVPRSHFIASDDED